MHFASANLEFNDAFVWGDDGGVKGLVTVLFGEGDIIFDAFGDRAIERVDEAEGEVTRGNVVDDNADGGEVVDFVDVTVVFGEFFVEGVGGFDATGELGGEFFFFEEDSGVIFDFGEGFGTLFVVGFDEVFEVVVATTVEVGEADVGDFGAD